MARQKTTLYLEDEDYRRLKSLARAAGRPPAALVREAVAEYVAARGGGVRRARSVGAFTSGRGDLGERAEELLEGFGRRRAKKR
jgi:hypothetical protein